MAWPTPAAEPLPSKIPPDTARQAVQWWVALRADAPEPQAAQRLQQDLLQWRAADPIHEAAWQRIESMSGEMAGLSLPLAKAALGAPASARRRRSVKLLTVALVTGISATALFRSGAWTTWSADVVAGLGEQRATTLPDGGSVVLNSGTAINVRYSDQLRMLQLLRGEILVQTAHDAMERPFVVKTELGSLRALGTRFTVRERGDALEIAVLQGAVELRPLDGQGDLLVLQAGSQGRMTRTESERSGSLSADATAWTEGMLVVFNMRLDAFLAELSRYRRGRLGCDAEVAHLLVSGVYPLADTDRVLASLSLSLPVEVHTFSRFWITVRAAPAASS